ncbi:MAG TPA: OB-fold domain-containing protein [Paraburkholderia sp.]|nr:OB-fold domain-containing protein [Paraburkholderia sp.]
MNDTNDTPGSTPAYVFAPPAELPDNAPFWQAAREQRLLVKQCDDCSRLHWYPRPLCPYCMGTTHWRQASGRGTVYTYSIARRAGPAPFCIAYVTLEEGITLLTHIVDWERAPVHIGQPVRVTFAQTDGGPPVPVFVRA